MQELRNAIENLVGGYPKQATATIDSLMSSNSKFFQYLTALIVGSQTQQLKGKQVAGALATLNTLALRCKNRSQIKDFLVLQEIYGCIKCILASQKVTFENKKMLCPALTELLSNSCSTHKQILDLKNYLQSCTKQSPSLIFLRAIADSKELQINIKIQCILQLFGFAVQDAKISILEISQSRIQNQNGHHYQHHFHKISQIQIQSSFSKIKYFIETARLVVECVLNSKMEITQTEAAEIITNHNQFVNILFNLIQWKNPQQNEYRYVWTKDTKINGFQIQFFQLNKIKQKSFNIISLIMSKTDPQYNLMYTSHPLYTRIPQLSISILQQLMAVSSSPQKLDELSQQFLIYPICDSMILVIVQLLKFRDIMAISQLKCRFKYLAYLCLSFCKLRKTDITGEQDSNYFMNFLQGFAGSINFNQITRYAITKLMKVCSNKFDGFSNQMFTCCYNNLILQIQNRIQQKQNFYSRLKVPFLPNNDQLCIRQQQLANMRISITNSLLLIICMQEQIKNRHQFQSAVMQFVTVLDLKHFQGTQISIIYFILGNNLFIFQRHQMVDIAQKFINFVFHLDSIANNQCNLLICLQFVKHFYCDFACSTSLNTQITGKLINIVQRTVWTQFTQAFNNQIIIQSQYFYDVLRQMLQFHYLFQSQDLRKPSRVLQRQSLQKYLHKAQQQQHNSNQKNKNYKRLKQETINDYLIKQLSKFTYAVLQKSCATTLHMMQLANHEQIIVLRLHQIMVTCLKIFQWLNQYNPEQVEQIKYNCYANILCKMVEEVINIADRKQIAVQQILQQVQIVSILINHSRYNNKKCNNNPSYVGFSIYQKIFHILVDYPFGKSWLICMCQLFHNYHSKIDLEQHDQIMKMLLKLFNDVSYNILQQSAKLNQTNQTKLNELSLFAMVFLNYQLPEKWCKMHEMIRVYFIKLLKVESQKSKIDRKKKMIELGYYSQHMFGITVIRLFHVYLFGFRVESNNELLQQILVYFQNFTQKYCVIQASHLIIGFKSSFRQMNRQNFRKILQLILLILNKLIMNYNYYGNQTYEQNKLRRLSENIGNINTDPYQQFRSLVQQMESQGINLIEDYEFGPRVKSTFGINLCKGQPRKLYTILKPKISSNYDQ